MLIKLYPQYNNFATAFEIPLYCRYNSLALKVQQQKELTLQWISSILLYL
jgi:hypothetical protein